MKEAGEVATSGEAKNITKNAELAMTHHVTPLVIETSGVFGKRLISLSISIYLIAFGIGRGSGNLSCSREYHQVCRAGQDAPCD